MTLWGRRSTRLDKRGLLVRTLVLFMFIALVGTACSDSDEPAAPEPAAPEPARTGASRTGAGRTRASRTRASRTRAGRTS